MKWGRVSAGNFAGAWPATTARGWPLNEASSSFASWARDALMASTCASAVSDQIDTPSSFTSEARNKFDGIPEASLLPGVAGGGRVGERRAIGAVSERPEFRGFWRVIEIFLQISEICVMMPSKKGKATEQAKRHGQWQGPPGRIGARLNIGGDGQEKKISGGFRAQVIAPRRRCRRDWRARERLPFRGDDLIYRRHAKRRNFQP